MKTLASILLSFSLLAQNVTLSRSGSQRPTEGDPRYFTGSVRVELVLSASEPSRLSGARVTFDPGARTAWHTHPVGQTLIVTRAPDGCNTGATPCRKWGKET
jgi:4-carboxymuconolactone decarboxylase